MRRTKAETKGVVSAGEPDAVVPQCPKPGPHAGGWAIEGRGAYAGVVTAWYCKTHGRNELVFVKPTVDPLGPAEQAVVDEQQAGIDAQQEVENAAAYAFETASMAAADAQLVMLRAQEEADTITFYELQGRRSTGPRPDVAKAKRELTDRRDQLQAAEARLVEERARSHRMHAEFANACRVARDRDKGLTSA